MLRERGALEAAQQLEHRELPAALLHVRDTVDSDAALQKGLDAIFARERERVADAAVLAELLAPMLSQRGAAALASEAAAASAPAAEPLEHETNLEPLPSPLAHRDPADIAQFIDDMIAQERPPARGPHVRRAS